MLIFFLTTNIQSFLPIISTDIPPLFFAYLTNRNDNWINHGERWRILDNSLMYVDRDRKKLSWFGGCMDVFYSIRPPILQLEYWQSKDENS